MIEFLEFLTQHPEMVVIAVAVTGCILALICGPLLILLHFRRDRRAMEQGYVQVQIGEHKLWVKHGKYAVGESDETSTE